MGGGGAEKPTVLVVAAIVEREGRLLLNRRPAGDALEGKWEFPGGKVEPGEDPRHALVRECREELGCRVEVGSVYETIHADTERAWLLLLFYTARIVFGEPRPMEGNGLAWVAPEELAGLDLLEADLPLVGLIRRRFPHYTPGVS